MAYLSEVVFAMSGETNNLFLEAIAKQTADLRSRIERCLRSFRKRKYPDGSVLYHNPRTQWFSSLEEVSFISGWVYGLEYKDVSYIVIGDFPSDIEWFGGYRINGCDPLQIDRRVTIPKGARRC